MKKFKSSNKLTTLLSSIEKKTVFDEEIASFMEMVNLLEYLENPNYGKLQDILMKCQEKIINQEHSYEEEIEDCATYVSMTADAKTQ